MLTFKSGHEALRHIIKLYEIKELRIPYYLCDIVRHTLVEENCKPIFYHIDDNFLPAEEFPKEDYILYPNYFGICTKNVKNLISKYPKLILDNAHAYYEKPQGFACFYCGHKFGYKGAELYLNTNIQFTDFHTRSSQKAKFRKQKFLNLHEKYSDKNLLDVDINSVPFVYPYLAETVNQADYLVKQLKQEGKTIYRYWNLLPESFNEYKFYSRLVPIPIDE